MCVGSCELKQARLARHGACRWQGRLAETAKLLASSETLRLVAEEKETSHAKEVQRLRSERNELGEALRSSRQELQARIFKVVEIMSHQVGPSPRFPTEIDQSRVSRYSHTCSRQTLSATMAFSRSRLTPLTPLNSTSTITQQLQLRRQGLY